MCVSQVEENVYWSRGEGRFRKGHMRKTNLGVGSSGKAVKQPWASHSLCSSVASYGRGG